MLYSLLLIVAVGVLIYGNKRWKHLPEADRSAFVKKALLYGAVGSVLGLVLVGKAHWLMGVLAALLALAGRVAQFAQYIPLFKKIMGDEPASAQTGSTNTGSSKIVAGSMSKQDAADILGIDVSAEPDDVRMAHKRLMQKMHPDRGGSDALAKQINRAKNVLLSLNA